MQTPQLFALSSGKIQTLHLRTVLCLNIVTGRLWITCTNDSCDHFLDSTQSLVLPPGRVVLQAEQDSTFRLHRPHRVNFIKKPGQLSSVRLVRQTS